MSEEKDQSWFLFTESFIKNTLKKKNKCKLYTFKTLTYLQSAEPQR